MHVEPRKRSPGARHELERRQRRPRVVVPDEIRTAGSQRGIGLCAERRELAPRITQAVRIERQRWDALCERAQLVRGVSQVRQGAIFASGRGTRFRAYAVREAPALLGQPRLLPCEADVLVEARRGEGAPG